MAKQDLYAEEMRVWLDQQGLRLKSCEISIDESSRFIANFKELIRLERAQAAIVHKVIKDGKATLAKYLANKNKLKKKKCLSS